METDRDIACRGFANGKDGSSLTARDVMSNGVICYKDEEELDDALGVMESNKVRRLPVIDSKKRMVGTLSLGDISHAVSHELSGEVIEAVSAHHQ
jgi:CBS domain-containing protein